jgi:hypothetical protein
MKKINLFWRQTRNLELREKERENNVTHALLILLEKNHNLLNKLLSKVNINNINKKEKEILYQVTNKENNITRDSKNKFILFIYSKYNEQESKGVEVKKIDIPDGLIRDNNTSIIIESKFSSSKDNSQIKRYNKTYFNNQAKIIEITWEEIYDIISEHKIKLNSIEGYLMQEFKEYLEVIQLSGFSGIPFFKIS